MIRTVVYLHGFLSSPMAKKAQVLAKALEPRGLTLYAPDLTMSPDEVAQCLSHWAQGRDMSQVAVVGASLGGFYAAWFASRYPIRSVLLNPATRPWEILSRYVGVQRLYDSDRTFDVKAEFGAMLNRMNASIPVSDEKRLVIVTTGDAVVDYRQTLERFPGNRCHVVEGSDHGISDFATMVDDVVDFATGGDYKPLAR